MGGTSAQINSKTVAISAVAELGEEAMALVSPDVHPLDFVALLMEKKLYPDAVRFVAHALPKREAVWWAWVCARRSAGRAAAGEDQRRARCHGAMGCPTDRREPALGHGGRRKGRTGYGGRLYGTRGVFQRRQPGAARGTGCSAGRVSGCESGVGRGDLRRGGQGTREGAGKIQKLSSRRVWK